MLSRVAAVAGRARFNGCCSSLLLSPHRRFIGSGDKQETPAEPSKPSASKPPKPSASKPPKPSASNPPKFQLLDADLEEHFVRGTGPGGQAVNKTSNAVQLLHVPTRERVMCQQTRCLQTNRKIARALLTERVERMVRGSASKMGRREQRAKRAKVKQGKRSAEKYGGGNAVDGKSRMDKLARFAVHLDEDHESREGKV